MSELRDFFKNNEVKVGLDYQLGTPLYFDSLRSGFFHYFSTYLDHKDIIHLILDADDWTKENFSHSRIEYNLSQSILSFHRFFELFLKDVLRKINPYLAVKFLEREDELFDFFEKNLPAENIKTIEFGESLKRFKQAFKTYSAHSEIYETHLKEVSFLNEKIAIEGLEFLSEWRNRIMHNGSTFPNLFAYEYLITQRILPLIFKIVGLETKKTNFEPHYFVTLSGIEIVKNLTDIEFDFKAIKNKTKENLRSIFYLISHLKELGRASFTQDFYRRKDRDYKELQYDNPIQRAERFAQVEKDVNPECFAINRCNCCGANSQIIYRREFDSLITKQKEISSWLRCFNCDYTIGSNISDPYLFGLSSKPLFPID